MARIFDNMEEALQLALQGSLAIADSVALGGGS
jgi:hypothetical protein